MKSVEFVDRRVCKIKEFCICYRLKMTFIFEL